MPAQLEYDLTWPIVAPDLRGRGESSHTPGNYRLEDFAADVASLCESLFGGAPAIIYGHSLGGQVGLVLAAARPSLVGGIIVGDSPLSLATLQHATEPGRPLVTTWRDLAASLAVINPFIERLAARY